MALSGPNRIRHVLTPSTAAVALCRAELTSAYRDKLSGEAIAWLAWLCAHELQVCRRSEPSLKKNHTLKVYALSWKTSFGRRAAVVAFMLEDPQRTTPTNRGVILYYNYRFMAPSLTKGLRAAIEREAAAV